MDLKQLVERHGALIRKEQACDDPTATGTEEVSFDGLAEFQDGFEDLSLAKKIALVEAECLAFVPQTLEDRQVKFDFIIDLMRDLVSEPEEFEVFAKALEMLLISSAAGAAD